MTRRDWIAAAVLCAAAVNGGPVTKIETVSVAPVFAEAIKRIHSGQSLSSLFL